VDLGFGVVVVRNVPATVCDQCGEEWIGAEIAGELERLVEEARQSRREVEVVSL
jgi:Zn-finger nucleic acid-binding protein